MRRALTPIAAALIGLAGSLAATLWLHRAAAAALDRVLEERLRGAGETAARLLASSGPSQRRLREVMEANRLEGAYVVTRELHVAADASGAAGGAVDLLRTDPARVERALRGEVGVGRAFALGDVSVDAAYLPVWGADGEVRSVLVLEAGEAFGAARAGLRRALAAGVALSALGALALAVASQRWTRSERLRLAARRSRGWRRRWRTTCGIRSASSAPRWISCASAPARPSTRATGRGSTTSSERWSGSGA